MLEGSRFLAMDNRWADAHACLVSCARAYGLDLFALDQRQVDGSTSTSTSSGVDLRRRGWGCLRIALLEALVKVASEEQSQRVKLQLGNEAERRKEEEDEDGVQLLSGKQFRGQSIHTTTTTTTTTSAAAPTTEIAGVSSSSAAAVSLSPPPPPPLPPPTSPSSSSESATKSPPLSSLSDSLDSPPVSSSSSSSSSSPPSVSLPVPPLSSSSAPPSPQPPQPPFPAAKHYPLDHSAESCFGEGRAERPLVRSSSSRAASASACAPSPALATLAHPYRVALAAAMAHLDLCLPPPMPESLRRALLEACEEKKEEQRQLQLQLQGCASTTTDKLVMGAAQDTGKEVAATAEAAGVARTAAATDAATATKISSKSNGSSGHIDDDDIDDDDEAGAGADGTNGVVAMQKRLSSSGGFDRTPVALPYFQQRQFTVASDSYSLSYERDGASSSASASAAAVTAAAAAAVAAATGSSSSSSSSADLFLGVAPPPSLLTHSSPLLTPLLLPWLAPSSPAPSWPSPPPPPPLLPLSPPLLPLPRPLLSSSRHHHHNHRLDDDGESGGGGASLFGGAGGGAVSALCAMEAGATEAAAEAAAAEAAAVEEGALGEPLLGNGGGAVGGQPHCESDKEKGVGVGGRGGSSRTGRGGFTRSLSREYSQTLIKSFYTSIAVAAATAASNGPAANGSGNNGSGALVRQNSLPPSTSSSSLSPSAVVAAVATSKAVEDAFVNTAADAAELKAQSSLLALETHARTLALTTAEAAATAARPVRSVASFGCHFTAREQANLLQHLLKSAPRHHDHDYRSATVPAAHKMATPMRSKAAVSAAATPTKAVMPPPPLGLGCGENGGVIRVLSLRPLLPGSVPCTLSSTSLSTSLSSSGSGGRGGRGGGASGKASRQQRAKSQRFALDRERHLLPILEAIPKWAHDAALDFNQAATPLATRRLPRQATTTPPTTMATPPMKTRETPPPPALSPLTASPASSGTNANPSFLYSPFQNTSSSSSSSKTAHNDGGIDDGGGDGDGDGGIAGGGGRLVVVAGEHLRVRLRCVNALQVPVSLTDLRATTRGVPCRVHPVHAVLDPPVLRPVPGRSLAPPLPAPAAIVLALTPLSPGSLALTGVSGYAGGVPFSVSIHGPRGAASRAEKGSRFVVYGQDALEPYRPHPAPPPLKRGGGEHPVNDLSTESEELESEAAGEVRTTRFTVLPPCPRLILLPAPPPVSLSSKEIEPLIRRKGAVKEGGEVFDRTIECLCFEETTHSVALRNDGPEPVTWLQMWVEGRLTENGKTAGASCILHIDTNNDVDDGDDHEDVTEDGGVSDLRDAVDMSNGESDEQGPKKAFTPSSPQIGSVSTELPPMPSAATATPTPPKTKTSVTAESLRQASPQLLRMLRRCLPLAPGATLCLPLQFLASPALASLTVTVAYAGPPLASPGPQSPLPTPQSEPQSERLAPTTPSPDTATEVTATAVAAAKRSEGWGAIRRVSFSVGLRHLSNALSVTAVEFAGDTDDGNALFQAADGACLEEEEEESPWRGSGLELGAQTLLSGATQAAAAVVTSAFNTTTAATTDPTILRRARRARGDSLLCRALVTVKNALPWPVAVRVATWPSTREAARERDRAGGGAGARDEKAVAVVVVGGGCSRRLCVLLPRLRNHPAVAAGLDPFPELPPPTPLKQQQQGGGSSREDGDGGGEGDGEKGGAGGAGGGEWARLWVRAHVQPPPSRERVGEVEERLNAALTARELALALLEAANLGVEGRCVEKARLRRDLIFHLDRNVKLDWALRLPSSNRSSGGNDAAAGLAAADSPLFQSVPPPPPPFATSPELLPESSLSDQNPPFGTGAPAAAGAGPHRHGTFPLAQLIHLHSGKGSGVGGGGGVGNTVGIGMLFGSPLKLTVSTKGDDGCGSDDDGNDAEATNDFHGDDYSDDAISDADGGAPPNTRQNVAATEQKEGVASDECHSPKKRALVECRVGTFLPLSFSAVDARYFLCCGGGDNEFSGATESMKTESGGSKGRWLSHGDGVGSCSYSEEELKRRASTLQPRALGLRLWPIARRADCNRGNSAEGPCGADSLLCDAQQQQQQWQMSAPSVIWAGNLVMDACLRAPAAAASRPPTTVSFGGKQIVSSNSSISVDANYVAKRALLLQSPTPHPGSTRRRHHHDCHRRTSFDTSVCFTTPGVFAVGLACSQQPLVTTAGATEAPATPRRTGPLERKGQNEDNGKESGNGATTNEELREGDERQHQSKNQCHLVVGSRPLFVRVVA